MKSLRHLAFVLVAAFAVPAHASVDIANIDPTLKELKFGQGFDAIGDWIGKRLDRIYLPRIARASDANERARLRARREQEVLLMKNAEVIFDGRETGLDGSIIGSEFGVGTEESLFTYKEGLETHYFFMLRGKLWKYGRTLDAGPSYLERVGTFQQVVGAPVNMADEPDGNGGRRMLSVTWKNAGFDVRLVNRRMVYGADLLLIEDRGVAAELTALREKAKKPGLGGVDPSMDEFLLDDPDNYGNPPPDKTPKPDPGKGKGKGKGQPK